MRLRIDRALARHGGYFGVVQAERFVCTHAPPCLSSLQVLIRIDHALGDGFGMMRAFLAACEQADGTPYPDTAFEFVGKSRGGGGGATRGRGGALAALGGALAFVWKIGWSFGMVLREVSRKDTRTAFSSPPVAPFSGVRKAVLSPAISLPRIKQLKTTIGAGCTVNDVLSACLAGALRTYITRAEASERASERAAARRRPRHALAPPPARRRDDSSCRRGDDSSVVALCGRETDQLSGG